MAAAKRVCFLYIAQHHQVWHSLSVAVAMARRWPAIKVEIAATTPELLDYVSGLLAELGGAAIELVLLPPAWLRRFGGGGAPPKALMLIANARRLSRYDAVITPERTTALLRRLGVRHPLLVYTQHGAGDRGGPFEPRLKQFDLVMAAGRDVGEALVGSDQSPRPGLRVGQVPVLQRVDVGIISVCRERLDVLLPDEAQHQSIGPHREGTAGLDIAHRLRVLPKWSAGQPNFVTPARRPWQAVGLYDARHDEQRCGGARRDDHAPCECRGPPDPYPQRRHRREHARPGRVADGRLRCA